MAQFQGDLEKLLTLARERTAESHQALVSSITDICMQSHQRLNERERDLLTDILGKLVADFEKVVRCELAKKLATWETAPHAIIVMLANDEIEVARPILMKSEVLRDPDLLEIIQNRSRQHHLSIAMRRELSQKVSDELVSLDDPQVMRALLENTDISLSKFAMEYLVNEAERLDMLQSPLVRREELSLAMARKLCLWVGAELRSYLLSNFDIDPQDLDPLLQQTLEEVAPSGGQIDEKECSAMKLARQLVEEGRAKPDYLVEVLRQGEIPLFEALVAVLTDLQLLQVQRFIYRPGGEGLVVLSRALKIDKPVFTSIFLMSRRGRPGDQKVAPDELGLALKLFDRINHETAQSILARWRLSDDYRQASDKAEKEAHFSGRA